MGTQVTATGNSPLVLNILSDEGSFQGSQTRDIPAPQSNHRVECTFSFKVVMTRIEKRKEREPPKLDDFESSIHAANALFYRKRYMEANSKYETVLGQYRYHLTALYRQSVGFWKSGFVNQALANLKELLSKYPKDAEARATKGAILIQKSEYKAAIEALKESACLDPSLEFIQHVLLENCYYAFRQIPEIVTRPSLKPEKEDQALLKAIEWASQNNYRRAVQEFSKTNITDTNSLSSKVLTIFKSKIHDSSSIQPHLIAKKISPLPVASLLYNEPSEIA